VKPPAFQHRLQRRCLVSPTFETIFVFYDEKKSRDFQRFLVVERDFSRFPISYELFIHATDEDLF